MESSPERARLLLAQGFPTLLTSLPPFLPTLNWSHSHSTNIPWRFSLDQPLTGAAASARDEIHILLEEPRVHGGGQCRQALITMGDGRGATEAQQRHGPHRLGEGLPARGHI